MHRLALLLALVLVLAACGDDDTGSTTLPPTDSTTTTSTTAGDDGADTTVPSEDETTSTTSSGDPDGTPNGAADDCREIWPESLVTAVAGDGYSLIETSDPLDACTFADLPDTITLSFRDEGLEGFEASKQGASAAATAMQDIPICDAAWVGEIAGALVILEAHSAAIGRTFTATMSVTSTDQPQAWASSLIHSAC